MVFLCYKKDIFHQLNCVISNIYYKPSFDILNYKNSITLLNNKFNEKTTLPTLMNSKSEMRNMNSNYYEKHGNHYLQQLKQMKDLHTSYKRNEIHKILLSFHLEEKFIHYYENIEKYINLLFKKRDIRMIVFDVDKTITMKGETTVRRYSHSNVNYNFRLETKLDVEIEIRQRIHFDRKYWNVKNKGTRGFIADYYFFKSLLVYARIHNIYVGIASYGDVSRVDEKDYIVYGKELIKIFLMIIFENKNLKNKYYRKEWKKYVQEDMIQSFALGYDLASIYGKNIHLDFLKKTINKKKFNYNHNHNSNNNNTTDNDNDNNNVETNQQIILFDDRKNNIKKAIEEKYEAYRIYYRKYTNNNNNNNYYYSVNGITLEYWIKYILFSFIEKNKCSFLL